MITILNLLKVFQKRSIKEELMKIATSVLSCSTKIEDCMTELNQTSSNYLHLDVMDGNFVSNDTVDMMDEVLKYNQLPLDIHLMVEDVDAYITKYQSFHPTYMTFHIEASKETEKVIKRVKSFGIKVGIALNPETEISLLELFLKDIDLVLVMSVTPGKGGQSFRPEALEHIRYLIQKREENGYQYEIEVDGGIKEDTISLVSNVDMVVSGSYIINGIYEEQIQKLREKCK